MLSFGFRSPTSSETRPWILLRQQCQCVPPSTTPSILRIGSAAAWRKTGRCLDGFPMAFELLSAPPHRYGPPLFGLFDVLVQERFPRSSEQAGWVPLTDRSRADFPHRAPQKSRLESATSDGGMDTPRHWGKSKTKGYANLRIWRPGLWCLGLRLRTGSQKWIGAKLSFALPRVQAAAIDCTGPRNASLPRSCHSRREMLVDLRPRHVG